MRHMWQFKVCVADFTFGVSRFKNYVFLKHREQNSNTFLNWNTDEKVSLIENHHNDFIVLTLPSCKTQ